MYIRTIGIAILVVSGLVAGLPAQSKTFPVSELKPGMVATGRKDGGSNSNITDEHREALKIIRVNH